jgi:hypothetical protein
MSYDPGLYQTSGGYTTGAFGGPPVTVTPPPGPGPTPNGVHYSDNRPTKPGGVYGPPLPDGVDPGTPAPTPPPVSSKSPLIFAAVAAGIGIYVYNNQ